LREFQKIGALNGALAARHPTAGQRDVPHPVRRRPTMMCFDVASRLGYAILGPALKS
jgi:hypothetical protein